MCRRKLAVAVSVLSLVLIGACPLFAEKVLLRARFKQGDKYVSEIKSVQDISQDMPNQKVELKQTVRFVMSNEVLSADDAGVAEVRMTYDRVALKQTSPMMTIDYDSGDPEKSEVKNVALVGFKALVGKSLKMKVTSRGEILGVTGSRKIAEDMLEQIREGEAREAARKSLANMMDDERFKEQMAKAGLVLPEDAVDAGDSWTQTQSLDMGGFRARSTTKYTVKEITADQVKVDVATTFEQVDVEGQEEAPFAVVIDEGSQSGATVLDRANALFAQSELQQKMKMSVTMGPNKLNMEMTATNTTTVKPVE